jgi:hypothetical protein
MNLSRARLQYEVLGLSPADIADDMGLAPYMLEDEIKTAGWRTIWPKVDVQDVSDSKRVDLVLEDSNNRLKVFNALLAIHLAPKYLELEVSLLDSSIEAMADPDIPPATLAAVARVYTSLRQHASSAQMTADDDNLGMPSVTIKNLSGKDMKTLENTGVVAEGTCELYESLV